MSLVIHVCIGMPMASLNCQKRILDAHSKSMKMEYRKSEQFFVTDFTESCPNDIGDVKDEYFIKFTAFPSYF